MDAAGWVWQGVERERFAAWLAEHRLPGLDDDEPPTSWVDETGEKEWRTGKVWHRVFGPVMSIPASGFPTNVWYWHNTQVHYELWDSFDSATDPLGDERAAELVARARQGEKQPPADGETPVPPLAAWMSLLLLANRRAGLSMPVRRLLESSARELGPVLSFADLYPEEAAAFRADMDAEGISEPPELGWDSGGRVNWGEVAPS